MGWQEHRTRIVDRREPVAPLSTLHRILVDYGYCGGSKSDFGSLLRMSGSNAYAYLRDDDDERRIRSKPATIHAWCWAVGKVTKLGIAIVLDRDGSFSFVVEGRDAKGQEITPKVYPTRYTDLDFAVNKPWEPEWQRENPAREDGSHA